MTEIIFDNGKDTQIIHDTEAGALKIHFSSKPAVEIRDYLKKEMGFKWAPRNEDWEHIDNQTDIEKVKVFINKFYHSTTKMKPVDKDISLTNSSENYAPDGSRSLLPAEDYNYIHSKEFIERFGDWEKAFRLEKLRKADSVISDNKIMLEGRDLSKNVEYLRQENEVRLLQYIAREIGKTVAGTYHNVDRNEDIELTMKDIDEIKHHNILFENHMESIKNIPEIINKAIYISQEENTAKDQNPDIEKYEYYVTGLKINNENYTCKSVICITKSGHRYYDKNLSTIEKGLLLDFIQQKNKPGNLSPLISPWETEPLREGDLSSVYYDKSLIEICQCPQKQFLNEHYEPAQSIVKEIRAGKNFSDLIAISIVQHLEINEIQQTENISDPDRILERFNDDKIRYQLLSRMQTDCKYFVDGHAAEKHLWSGNVKDQIRNMRLLFNSFKDKPEWITIQEINQYEKDMLSSLNNHTADTIIYIDNCASRIVEQHIQERLGQSVVNQVQLNGVKTEALHKDYHENNILSKGSLLLKNHISNSNDKTEKLILESDKPVKSHPEKYEKPELWIEKNKKEQNDLTESPAVSKHIIEESLQKKENTNERIRDESKSASVADDTGNIPVDGQRAESGNAVPGIQTAGYTRRPGETVQTEGREEAQNSLSFRGSVPDDLEAHDSNGSGKVGNQPVSQHERDTESTERRECVVESGNRHVTEGEIKQFRAECLKILQKNDSDITAEEKNCIDDKKISAWSAIAGVHFPVEAARQPDEYKILPKSNFVNELLELNKNRKTVFAQNYKVNDFTAEYKEHPGKYISAEQIYNTIGTSKIGEEWEARNSPDLGLMEENGYFPPMYEKDEKIHIFDDNKKIEYISTKRQAAAFISYRINTERALNKILQIKQNRENCKVAEQKIQEGNCTQQMKNYYQNVLAGKEVIPTKELKIAERNCISEKQDALLLSKYPNSTKEQRLTIYKDLYKSLENELIKIRTEAQNNIEPGRIVQKKEEIDWNDYTG